MTLTIQIKKVNGTSAMPPIESGDRMVLSFTQDGDHWESYELSGRILHKILVTDREQRELVKGSELEYRRLNGHSFRLIQNGEESE